MLLTEGRRRRRGGILTRLLLLRRGRRGLTGSVQLPVRLLRAEQVIESPVLLTGLATLEATHSGGRRRRRGHPVVVAIVPAAHPGGRRGEHSVGPPLKSADARRGWQLTRTLHSLQPLHKVHQFESKRPVVHLRAGLLASAQSGGRASLSERLHKRERAGLNRVEHRLLLNLLRLSGGL